ncbi:hypothetical protein C5B42_02720, partial [Candidatus Cerribacteria bacterium 'Amazon FNV 2010 28 9']
MQLDTSTVWSRALSDMAVGMSSQHYHMWIEKVTLGELREVGDDRAIGVLFAQSAMHLQMVEGRFYASIKEALDRVTGRKVELQFKVGTLTPQPQLENNSQEVSASHHLPTKTEPPLFASLPVAPTIDALKAALLKAKLRPDFTFDNFAVSTTNEMAHAAAIAVSK